MRYEYHPDLAARTAIDVHVHIEQSDDGHTSLPTALTEASAAYFKAEDRSPTLDVIAERHRAENMAAVVFTVDARTALKHEPNSIEEIVAGCVRHNDVLIPFGSVDPHQGPVAVDRARRMVEEWGVRGFKFHPSLQGFDPSDERFYPLYQAISDLGVPALFHTGQNGIEAAQRVGVAGARGPHVSDTAVGEDHVRFPVSRVARIISVHALSIRADRRAGRAAAGTHGVTRPNAIQAPRSWRSAWAPHGIRPPPGTPRRGQSRRAAAQLEAEAGGVLRAGSGQDRRG